MVSAIVSAYFARDFIEQRLRNLLEQVPQPEIVVVCQHDSFEHRVCKDLRIGSVFTTPNIPTLPAAWNKAVLNAKGDYIVNANSDDEFVPGALAKMAAVLDAYPDVGLVFGDAIIQTKDSTKSTWKRICQDAGIVPESFKLLMQHAIIGPFPMWRKSLHDRFGLFDELIQITCDYDWWLRLSKAGVPFWYLNESVGIYHRRNNSLEFSNTERKMAEVNSLRRAYHANR